MNEKRKNIISIVIIVIAIMCIVLIAQTNLGTTSFYPADDQYASPIIPLNRERGGPTGPSHSTELSNMWYDKSHNLLTSDSVPVEPLPVR